ncbi:MAG: ATP-binding protein [Coriobacteriales bacterium]
MLKRKALAQMESWLANRTHQALLVTGARQVGKTYLVREFARTHWENVAELNFYENTEARDAIATASNSRELFLRLSAFSPCPLVPGKTVLFLDEVQEVKEVATAIKFLMERGDFDYILSGSMLGVELRDIRSNPVGFLSTVTMYPLDFEEFCWASGVGGDAIEEARLAYEERRPVDEFVDRRLNELLHRYLICGGMPDAVNAFAGTDNVSAVRVPQEAIATQYRHDISKYASRSRSLVVKRIFDLMPSEISKQNKRFVVKDISGDSHVDRYLNDFLWLADANVALPTYNVTEPRYPLRTSLESRKFKLFMSDVGLLTYLCGMDVVRDLAAGRADINYGAIYENFVAQELAAHGRDLLYYSSRGTGELDFLLQEGDRVVPVEVKSGKDYRRHSALDNALKTPNWGIERAIVLHEGNVEQGPGIDYLPAYMAMFL